MQEHRTQRVSEAIREELAELVAFELDDPRLTGAEVTAAHVTPDGRHAHVHIAFSGEAQEQQRAMAALEHASHYLRRELAVRLSLRYIPELHFELDRHPDAENRVEFLLKKARRSRGQK